MEPGTEPTVATGTFDRYARVLRRSLGVPTAIVTVVEADRQVLVGLEGLGSPWAETRQTPLTHSVCQYVVAEAAPLVIPDAHDVDFLADNLALPELGVVAYAGWPITDHRGRVVGAVAAIDSVAREWTEDDLAALADVAALCSTEMSERLRRMATLVDLAESERFAETSRLLLGLSEALSSTRSLQDIVVAVGRVTATQLGCLHAGIWLRDDVADVVDVDSFAIEGRPLRRVPVVGPPRGDWPDAELYSEVDVGETAGASLSAGEAVFESRVPSPASAEPGAGQARAFLPLVLGDRPLGLLVLVWPDAQEFDADQRVTMAALSSYTAQAVQRAALLEERVSVSVTLQRAMLTELPAVPDLELAARYLPAATREQVGGDWYDAVALPGGDTVVAVGDVTGHDIVAASVMSQLRSMLRAIVTISDDPPSHSLALLDRVVERVRLETIASALLVRLHPPGSTSAADGRWRLTWSRAGHLPAVLVDPDGHAELLGSSTDGRAVPDNDGLIGLGEGARHDHQRDVDPGSVLLLYTDGLVERRGEVLDRGLERLCGSVADHRAPLDELVTRVLEDQLGTSPPDDDVAVLAVRLG